MRWNVGKGDERGSVSVEAAVILPLLLFLFTVILQLGAVFYARGVASSAARQALDAARVAEGSEAAGHQAADQFLGQVSTGLQAPTVEVDRGAERVTVTVSGEVMSLVPGWSPEVTATVSAPTERVVE